MNKLHAINDPTRREVDCPRFFHGPLRVRLRVRKQIAGHAGCGLKVIHRIVNGHASVTAEMALKLAAAFRTTPEFWLNAQKAAGPCEASARIGKLPRPLRKVPSFTSVSPRTR